MYGGVKGKKHDIWRIKDYSTHPGPGIDGVTTAAGKYQINKGTWKDMGGKMGLSDFTPETQDLIAIEILRAVHGIDAVKDGDIPSAVSAASHRWSSLPQGPGQINRNPPQPYTKYPDVVSAFKGNGGVASKE